MAFTVVESDATSKTFNQTASTGYETRYLASDATFALKDEAFQKHTPAGESIDAVSRHIFSFRRTRMNSVTGKRSMAQAQLVLTVTNSPDIVVDDVEDVVAMAVNCFTADSTAKTATFNTRVAAFSLNASPV